MSGVTWRMRLGAYELKRWSRHVAAGYLALGWVTPKVEWCLHLWIRDPVNRNWGRFEHPEDSAWRGFGLGKLASLTWGPKGDPDNQ